MHTESKKHNELATVNRKDIENIADELYKLANICEEKIESYYWSYTLTASQKGLIIESYSDQPTDDTSYKLKTCGWDWVFSEMFTTGEKVNIPMIEAFTKGLNEMMADLKKNGGVYIHDHLKQATDLIGQ